MTHFAIALQKDLLAASAEVITDRKLWILKVMGQVADEVANTAELIKDNNFTPVEELQHFRRSLNLNLDWQYWMENVTVTELAQIRKIVDDLTATDHLTAAAI